TSRRSRAASMRTLADQIRAPRGAGMCDASRVPRSLTLAIACAVALALLYVPLTPRPAAAVVRTTEYPYNDTRFCNAYVLGLYRFDYCASVGHLADGRVVGQVTLACRVQATRDPVLCRTMTVNDARLYG